MPNSKELMNQSLHPNLNPNPNLKGSTGKPDPVTKNNVPSFVEFHSKSEDYEKAKVNISSKSGNYYHYYHNY